MYSNTSVIRRHVDKERLNGVSALFIICLGPTVIIIISCLLVNFYCNIGNIRTTLNGRVNGIIKYDQLVVGESRVVLA